MKTKRILAMAICAVLWLSSTVVLADGAVAPTNLLADFDPSFENGEPAEGVTKGSNTAWATDGGHTGKNSINLAIQSSWIQWDVRGLKPATNYTFSFWMKNSKKASLTMDYKRNVFTVDGVDFATVAAADQVKYDWFAAANGYIGSYTFGVERTETEVDVWRQVSVNFTTPYVDCNGIKLRLASIAADEHLRIDDVSLVETGKTPNRAYNGDMEAIDKSGTADNPSSLQIRHTDLVAGQDYFVKTENGNTYLHFNADAETSGNAVAAPAALIIKGSSLGKRYKVSYKYRTPNENRKPGIRFYNDEAYLGTIGKFPAAEANSWETYTLYIDATDFINKGNEFTAQNNVWVGFNSKKGYEMDIDDVYVWFDKSNIGFYEDLTFYDDGTGNRFFSGREQTAAEGETPATYYFENDLSSEKSVEATNLDALTVDASGYKTVTTRAHYLPVENANGTFEKQSITLISTVYKYENGKKTLVDITVETGTSENGQVIDVVDTVRVPANTATATYKVEAVAWDSISGLTPIMDKAVLD